MSNMMNDLLKKASSTGRFIEKKTKYITSIAKLNFNISQLNTKIEKEHIKIGAIIYDSRKNSSNENEYLINDCINKIDGYLFEINELNKQINLQKSDVICDVCGCSNNKSKTNCINCGNKLD